MIVLDIETTGLKVKEGAEILEISAIKYDNKGEEISKFVKKIKPKKDIPEFITKLTGITYEDMKDAPMIEDVVDEVKLFLGEETIVGHNVEFDLTFIKHFFEINDIKDYRPKTIDTLTLARKKIEIKT